MSIESRAVNSQNGSLMDAGIPRKGVKTNLDGSVSREVVIAQFQSGQAERSHPGNLPPLLEKILTLDPKDPDYPIKLPDSVKTDDPPFEHVYKHATAAKVGDSPSPDEIEKAYRDKYMMATLLIEDGRFHKLRFLVDEFIPAGQEVTPEIQALKRDLGIRVRGKLIKRGDREELRDSKKELEDFVQSVSEAKTPDAQEFIKLAGLFGGEYCIDILYSSKPEFRDIPVEIVNGVLADWIGAHLATRAPFNPEDIRFVAKHLSTPNLREALFLRLKNHCLSTYNLWRKAGITQGDEELIDEYFDIMKLEVEEFETPEVQEVFGRARKYYESLFDIKNPAHIVNALREGRRFPDLNQLINIKEVEEKRRILIADEMGLGKSASAIFAKEVLGVKQALITAPANVIPVWQEYLSDKVGEDGRQIGYFKEGSAPKVLVVDNQQALQNPNTSSYDYVIVSQERLDVKYIPQLQALDYDMLIVDEVHKLKNLREGKRASNLVQLAQKVEQDGYLVMLSGTPVPNKIIDVAMILKLLYPEEFKDMEDKKLVQAIIQGKYVDLRRALIPRMQMKGLAESVEMPELSEDTEWVDLSPLEKEVYEVLMEEDEIDGREKIRILRQFLLNPDLLDPTPGVESSKIRALERRLQKEFRTKNKVVMFVNDYIEDVIRGEKPIFSRMQLPEDVVINAIHGGVNGKDERRAAQDSLREPNAKVLLAVSGKTADVGVDFSGAEAVVFYNEPWTEYLKRQQLGRQYREGLQHPLSAATFIAKNTIEEGMHLLIEAKFRAIEKLLKGVPTTDIEREILKRSEEQEEGGFEVNPELARYYFSFWDKMMKFFGQVKNIGENDFLKFLSVYGKDYADCYTELGSRCYQANASRVSGTLIDRFVGEADQDKGNVRILDLASGPEMLKKHMPEGYEDRIYSVDINQKHFTDGSGKKAVGSFLDIPFSDNTFDYVNFSLALHYTNFLPTKNQFERVEALYAIQRALRVGGKAVINLIYTLDIKDMSEFHNTVRLLGFRIVDGYSGEAVSKGNYRSRMVTLEKMDTPVRSKKEHEVFMEEVKGSLDKKRSDGLKFQNTKIRLKDSRRIIKEFDLAGKTIPISFNKSDEQILEEEEEIIAKGEDLKSRYGTVKAIPKQDVVDNNFVRIKLDKKYKLFRRLQRASGVVLVQ